MRNAGLLIVTGLGVPSKMNETAYTILQDVLTMRAMSGKMNMFIDTPQGELLETFSNRTLPNREDVVKAYIKMFPASYRMHNLLVGPGVHIAGIDRAS